MCHYLALAPADSGACSAAILDQQVIGCIISRVEQDDQLHILTLGVLAPHRNSGIGQLLPSCQVYAAGHHEKRLSLPCEWLMVKVLMAEHCCL